ncbi:MAG: hypothetical protein FJ276_21305 [Planctomycetes bacterium]|nr:hypothetical protein [Planctomycetota bacterium]
MGEILTVKGMTLVISPAEGVTVSAGQPFEVLVDLPGELGTAAVAKGKVASVSDGIVLGKVESKDARVNLSTTMRVRFLPAAEQGEAAIAEEVDRHVTKKEVSREELTSFRDVFERYRKAVFVVKDAEDKSHGTAFAISKEHRLLVTNAHVADIADRVVLNETRTVYKVVQRWYHPDTIRTMNLDGQTVICSTDPSLGKVDVKGTDLAILELERLGPDLPAEVTLAWPDEVRQIVGSRVGTMGYPGYDTQAAPDQFAQATFAEGSVGRFERLNGHATDQPLEQRRLVQYSVPNYPGVSGSPVFLANGRVVVVANAVRELEQGGKVAYGIRVDALWDMLNQLKLSDKVPGAPASLPEPVFVPGQNPKALDLLKAAEELTKAEELKKDKQFRTSLEHVDKAEALAPTYWRTHYVRGLIFSDYIRETNLPRKEQAEMYEASLNAFVKAEEMHFQSFDVHPVPLLLEIARQGINSGRQSGNKDHLQRAINLLGDQNVARVALEGPNAAYFLALRASIQRDLGDYSSALNDINEAINRNPNNQSYKLERDRIVRALQQ